MKRICPKCNGRGSTIDPDPLRARRHKKQLTLAVVSKRMGISLPYLSQLEAGRKDWNPELVARFTKALA